jgi:hypothetical protein
MRTPSFTRLTLLAGLLAAALQPAEAHAQARPAPSASSSGSLELKGLLGYAGFIDESMIDHGMAGVAIRWLATPRLSLEAEVLHMRGPCEDRDWLVGPSVAWDLRARGTVIPFVAGGIGWLQTTLPVGTGLYSAGSWTGGGGGGVRVALSPRLWLTLDARLGSEPLTRLTAAIGWQFERTTHER